MDQGEKEKELESKSTSLFLDKLKERQLYVIIIGVVAVLFIAAIIYGIFYTKSNNVAEQDLAENTEEATANNENVNDSEVDDTAVVLPQKVRFEEGGSTTDLMVDPFVGPMKLKGIATGGYGGAMAIVESNGTSYIVTVGDYVDDLWAVYEITHERVVLRVHDQEVSLFFDQPPEIRNLERGFVEDDNDTSREGDE
ncbi:MAG: hypothetical protein SVV67_04205 [Bacillota bacterium]|nr:hypothetical protein [Bacillota bacterium]